MARTARTRRALAAAAGALEAERLDGYNYAFLDELSKKAIRRALLKGVAIPGYQVPFGSRELPIARGWGTGGLQITLSLVGPGDVLKVIDQGADEGVNAVNIRRLVERTSPGVETTLDTGEATLIQTRHRIPEQPLREDQIMIFQVPQPEPLRNVEWREAETRRMHAEADYSRIWVALYEDVVQNGRVTQYAGYPVMVNDRHVMAPSPIPKWDVPKLAHGAVPLPVRGRPREADLRRAAADQRGAALLRGLPVRRRELRRAALRPLRQRQHLPRLAARRAGRQRLRLLGRQLVRHGAERVASGGRVPPMTSTPDCSSRANERPRTGIAASLCAPSTATPSLRVDGLTKLFGPAARPA